MINGLTIVQKIVFYKVFYFYCTNFSFLLHAHKYPNGIETQKEKLEAEGHTIIQKGRKNVRYYVKDYENFLFDLKQEVAAV